MASSAKCTDARKGFQELTTESVDCIVTSPPYNIGIHYGAHNDSKTDAEYLCWLETIFREAFRTLKPMGHFFLQMGGTATDPRIPQRVLECALRCGYNLQNEIVWVKSISVGGTTHGQFKPLNTGRFLNRTHEFIFHLTKNGKVPIDRLSIGVPFVYSSNIERFSKKDKRCRGNVWFIPYETIQRKSEKFNHPAIFPVALPTMCIRLSGVPRGSLVIDPFVGSGTTLVACDALGMHGLGFDIDPIYVASANVRLLPAQASLLESKD